MNAIFADIHAAADFMGPGSIEVPLYQTEIFDICRRSSPPLGSVSSRFRRPGIPRASSRRRPFPIPRQQAL